MEFSRPEYWSGEPFPSPGHLPNPEGELGSPALQAGFFNQLSYQGMGCKTGKGACSPPSSSLRRVPLSCSETPKRWITIWRQIFLTHAQRSMLYLENTYFINLIIFMPDFWMKPLPWARWNWQSNQHSYMAEHQATWPSSLLIAFLLLILICLLLTVPLCHASNDFSWEDQNLFNIWNTP